MKVLIATPYYWPRVGGLERYVEAIAGGLTRAGWDVVVVCGDMDVRGMTSETHDGYSIYRLPVHATISNTPVHAGWPRMLRQICRYEQPDVINVHAPVPSMALAVMAARLHRPMVVTYHAGSMKKGRPIVDLLIGVYEKQIMPILMNQARSVVCASDFVREQFLTKWSAKSLTVTPGVDPKDFEPGHLKRGNRRLVFVGDFSDPRKGLDVLLESIKQLPDVTLRIVGRGQVIDDMQTEFTGVKRGDDLIAEMQQADALVLPSVTDAEAFGMVLIEAMACGTPVIGSDIGGIGGVIKDGSDGILVAPGDVQALAQAIERIVSDRRFAQRLGRAGRRKAVRDYSWETRVKTMAETLEAAV